MLHQVCLRVHKVDSSLLERLSIPVPLGVQTEKVFQNVLSDSTIVAIEELPAVLEISLKVISDGPRNHDHQGDPVEVAQVEVVDAALAGPTLGHDCHLTENA